MANGMAISSSTANGTTYTLVRYHETVIVHGPGCRTTYLTRRPSQFSRAGWAIAGDMPRLIDLDLLAVVAARVLASGQVEQLTISNVWRS